MRRVIRSLAGCSLALALIAHPALADDKPEGGRPAKAQEKSGNAKIKGEAKADGGKAKADAQAGHEHHAGAATIESATAELKNAAGEKVGEALLEDTPHGVLITATLTGLPPGTHAFHVHETGKCEGPDFKTAGGHFNPAGRKHGIKSAAGMHGGDLPNVEVPEGGKAKVQVLASDVTLGGKAGILDADGGALVLHAGVDDYQSDPAGNAGGRIACGVIAKK